MSRAGGVFLGALCAAALASAALAAASAPGPGAEGYASIRALEVPRAGLVRVPLGAGSGAAGFAAGDWTVISPGGAPVPSAVLLPLEGERPLRTLAVQEGAEGWALVFDLGPTPARHQRLTVEPARNVSARGCRLEGSADRTSWRLLTSGDLFRLGSGAGLGRSSLGYPPTDARYLRLRWPRAAGFPELLRATVEIAPEAVSNLPATGIRFLAGERPGSPASGSSVSYLLTLPATNLPVRRIDLRFSGADPLGFRLQQARQGEWQTLDEQELSRKGEPREARIDLSGGALEVDQLRLTEYGAAGGAGRLKSAALATASRWLLFEAGSPGRYLLASGRAGAGAAPPPPLDPSASSEPAFEVKPGEEQAPEPNALPSALAGSGVTIRGRDWKSAWKVTMPAEVGGTSAGSGAGGGTVVRLELPPEVLSSIGGDLSDLRVAAGDKVVPAAHWTPDEPALVQRLEGLAPQPGPGRGRSRIDLDLPEVAELASSLEIVAPGVGFDRRVSVEAVESERPGVERVVERSPLMQMWRCAKSAELPCSISFGAIRMGRARALRVVLDDGDRPPLPPLDIAVWRRRPTLIFMWPGSGGEVRLLWTAGRDAAGEELPRGAREVLLASRWTDAVVDPRAVESGERGAESRSRLYLLGALAAVALGLLGILARALRPRQP